MLKGKTPFKLSFLSFALIATTIVAIFFPILSYGWMNFEDPSYYLTSPLFSDAPLLNRLIAAWFNAPESNYIPLTWNLTILLAEFSPNSPQAFHAFSLLLHLLNSLLAFLLVRRLGLKTLPTIITILLFALHPLRVESVAWASSIKGLLAAFFALGALVLQTCPRLKLRSTAIVLLFLLSLLSKQTLLLLPFVHYLLSLLSSEYRLNKSTYSILGMLSVLGAVAASQANAANTLLTINQLADGSVAPLKALAALGHYLKLQFIPTSLFPEYPANRHWFLILLSALALIPLGLFAKKLLASPRPSLALVSFASFFILLSPTLGLLTTPLEFAADRLSYLPSLFFWLSLIFLLTRLPLPEPLNKARLAFPGALLLLFTPLTISQISHWKNDQSLTNHILAHQPNHYLANLHTANAHAATKDFQAALPFAKTLVEHHPYRYGGWKTFSQILIHLGNPEASLDSLEQALAEKTPIRADLYILRCQPLRTLGRHEEALESSQLALSHGISKPTFHHQNAIIYYSANEAPQALQEIQKGLAHSPDSPILLALKAKIGASMR